MHAESSKPYRNISIVSKPVYRCLYLSHSLWMSSCVVLSKLVYISLTTIVDIFQLFTKTKFVYDYFC